MSEREDGRKGGAYWDARYAAAPEGLFGGAPNQFLRMALARSDISAGTALMLADGDGRNGTWLATQGVAVTAVDISEEGARRARARDNAFGVTAERIVADLRRWTPDDRARRWDFSAILFLQGPADQRRAAARLAAETLAPGGWLALEGFAVAAEPGAIGPDDPAHRYAPAEVAAWLHDLVLVEVMTGDVLLEEGRRHRGVARIIRVLARRPARAAGDAAPQP